LSVDNANGVVQWQQTDDTTATWTDITGAVTEEYTHYAETSATGYNFYCLAIIDFDNCKLG